MNLKKCFYSVISKSILLFSLISILIFSSCEVGLGESVDTVAPSVEITYPPANSVIRGAFEFAGTCSDDKGVSSVSVTVLGTDRKAVRYTDLDGNSKEYAVPAAKVENDGKTWHILINEQISEGAYPLSDGTYICKVQAKDSSGRTSDWIERSFEIDNTEPVFIISSPAVTDTANATEYGSVFKISGKIADDHDIRKMNVTVYDKDGKIIEGNDTWTYTNVDTAGGMSITAARYFTKSGLSAAEQTLHNNYINIYGEGYTGDKIFTCTVELEDAAQEWVEPVYKTDLQPENIARGNVTTSLWLNDDIYEELMGANSAYQLEAGGIKKIWNGTDDEPAVLSILQDKRKDTAETKLAFSLNKKAEPTYSIGGYDMTGADFSGNSAAKNGKITFMANAGRNGIQVDPSTFTLYLFGPFEPASVDESFINGLYSKPAEKYNQYHKEQDSQAEILYSGADYKKGSVEAFTQTVTLPESITNGSRYIFAATGSDLDGLTLETSEGTFYGFTGIAAGTPPQVTISFPDDDAVIKSSEGLFITGTASSTESKIKEISYEITVYDYLKKDSGGNYIKVGTVTGFAEAVENTRFGDASVKYSCDVSKGTFVSADKNAYPSANPSAETDDGNGQIFVYEIVVVVRDDSASESNEKRRIYLDNAKPVPLITNVDPVAEKQKDEKGNIVEKKINGTVTISGKVTEKNLKSLVLTVKDIAGKTEIHSYPEASFEESIDTTLFSDGEVVFTLTATDEAGNESSVSENYKIDQTTDNPVIKFSNGKSTDDGVDYFNKVVNGQNIFGVENNNKALFSFTDDDGLEEIKITLCDEYGAGISLEENNDFNVQIQDGRKIAENPVIYTPDGSASYSVSYILPQKEGKYILDIEVTDVEYNNVGKRKDAETVRSYRKSTAKNYIVVSESNFVMKFADSKIVNDECEVKLEDTTVEGTISVTDKKKIKSIERYKMELVSDADGIKSWEKTGDPLSYYYGKDPSDKNPDTSDENPDTIEVSIQNNKLQWTETIPAGQLTEGENHFYYFAEDVTGNHTELELTCYADNTPPSVHSHSDTDKKVNVWLNSTSQTLTFIIQDEAKNGYASGIDSVKYSFKNGEGSTNEGNFARGAACDVNGNTDQNGAYTLYKTTFPLPEGESNLVIVTVSDRVGNTSSATKLNLKIDTNAPVVSVTPSITGGQVLQSSKKIPVAFGYTDATSGLKCVELSTDSSMKNNLVTLTETKSVSSYDYPLSGLSDGTHSIYVRATDNAGNKTSSQLAGSVTVDNTPPKVEIKTPVNGATVNKTIDFTGTVTDNNLPNPAEPVLQYKNGDVWTPLNYASTSLTNQEWTITGVDTTDLNKATSEQSFEFRVVFTDKAGNANESVGEYSLNIDQNADRPEIKLTNINITKSSISSNVVQGVISDDDGVSTKDGDYAKIKLYRIDSAEYDSDSETNKTPSTSGNKWKNVPVEAGTGIWKAEIAEAEGQGSKHWYFYVIDEAGGEFCTKSTSQLERPYLTDGSSEKSDNQTGITFFFDTTAPTVKISLSEDGTNYSTTNTIFGGSKQLYVRAEVFEEVGMAENTATKAPAVLYIGGEKKELAASVSPNEEKKYIYTFNPIALSGYSGDAPLSVSVTAEDSAGNTNKDILNITIDKDAPTVKIISPTTALSDAVSSSVSIKGIVQDDKSSIAKLEYVIPLTGETYSESDGTWNNMLVTGAAWELAFTSGSEESPDSLLYYVSTANLAANKYDVNEIETGLGIYKVPVYFRTTDSVGNVAVDKTQFVYVDPNGGKPKAWINAPEQGTVTSGTVTIYGGASDNVSVSKVCVQIDVNGDGIITEADYNLIKAKPEEYIGEYVEGMLVASTAVGNDWYILAGGTSSWKCPIVTNSIAVYTGTTGTEIGTQTVTNGKKYLVSRVRAIDGDNLTRSYTDYHCITIDDTAPWFTDLAVVQYGSGVTPGVSSRPIVEREYISGMYISNNSVEANGKWYLTGYVKSNTEINSIEANSLGSISTVVIDLPKIGTGVNTVQDITGSGTTDGYKLLIPLATDSSGMIYSELKSTNGVGTGNQTVKINIDSTAPSLYTTAGAESTTGTESLRLKSLSKVVGTDLTSNSVIENSDGYFTFGDNVIEAGSGLQFIAFYLQKKVGDQVYDPMLNKNGTSVSSSQTENALYINSDKLAAFYITGATRPTPYSLTHSSVDSEHVRIGGLVKIGGSYHTITNVEGKTVAFTPAASTSFTSAELIYAQVVDHQITEYFDTVYDSNDDAYYTLMNDDGDGMCETITQIGTTYQWTASVDSTNIPDGKTYIRVVAMDNAGNLSYGKIKSIVANNRPRMTKVFIGTDLNSSGKYDFDADEAPVVSTSSKYRTASGTCYGEFSYYTAYNTRSGVGQSVVSLDSSAFKVVKGLCIIPEFVGGNGSLKYCYDMNDTTLTPSTTTQTAMISRSDLESTYINKKEGSLNMFGTVSSTDTEGNTNPVAYSGTDISGNTYYDFGGVVIPQDRLSGASSVKLTFWDETDGAQSTCGSQWATLVVPFSNMTAEENKPAAKIAPFHWNSSTDNSVYISGAIAGHVEFEGSILTNTNYTRNLPKVSGKVKIEGYVYDDVRLASISMSVFGGDDTVVGNYSNGTWSQASSLPNGVVSFEAEDLDMSQKGHSVKYSVVIDTEKLSGVVGTEKVIKISAKDWRGNTSESSSDQTSVETAVWGDVSSVLDKVYYTDNSCTVQTTSKTSSTATVYTPTTAYYAMDVVPYVTEIWTGLSNTKTSAPSMYSRASTGEYVVRNGEVISVFGWNLDNSPNVTLGSSSITTSSIGTASKIISTYTDESARPVLASLGGATSGIKFTVPNVTSGALSITVQAIPALNNINDNDVHGNAAADTANYAGYYNRRPNGQNNNTLTDDLALDVWNFKQPITPVGAAANYVHMKVAPADATTVAGRIGFSFRNGAGVWNMPGYMYNNGTLYSHTKIGENYQGFTYNTFTWNKNGKPYGAALCSDTSGNDDQSANFQFFSEGFGMNDDDLNFNYKNCKNARRIENTKNSAGTYDERRVMSPAMATYYADNKTYIYMAYWDHLENRIIYRVGSVGKDSANDIGLGLRDLAGFTDYEPGNGEDESKIGSSKYPNRNSTDSTYTGNSRNGERSAYHYVKVLEAFSGVTDAHVAIGALSDGSAVIAWYDDVSCNLKMAKITKSQMLNTTSGSCLNEITVSSTKITSNGGAYVSMTVDSSDGIHLAYMSNSGANLYYCYVSSNFNTKNEVLVDVNDDVGDNCTIDVARSSESSPWIPTISYKSNVATRTKIAYPVFASSAGNSARPEAGADASGYYTGKWAICTLPSTNKSISDAISVGYNKNWSNGTWRNFATGTDTYATTTAKYTICDSAIVYGNGTSNPVVGYAVASGAIEMAQKK